MDLALPIDPAELAINDIDRSWLGPRQPSTLRTFLTFKADRCAFRARGQARHAVLSSTTLRRVLGSLVPVESPDDRLVDEAMLEHRAGMV